MSKLKVLFYNSFNTQAHISIYDNCWTFIINPHSPLERNILFTQPSGKHCQAELNVSEATRTAGKHLSLSLLFTIIFPGMWCLRRWEWTLHTQTNEYQPLPAPSLALAQSLQAAREASLASVNSLLEWRQTCTAGKAPSDSRMPFQTSEQTIMTKSIL